MLKIEIARSCAKDIKKFPAKIQKQLALKILELSKDPNANDVNSLKGHAPYKRATSGEYRIVFYITKDTLYIDFIAKRNDDEIYKKLKRSGR